MNKKGSGLDFLNVPLIIFTFILFVVIGWFILDAFKDGLNNLDGDSINKTLAVGYVDSGINSIEYFDYLFIFLFVGLTSSLWISAYYINSNPVFFWVSILLLFVVIILAAVFNNVYYEIAQTEMEDSVNAFPIMTHVMNNLALYCALIIISTIVILYSKGQRGGFEGF